MIIVSQRKGKRLVYTKEGGEYQFPDCFWTQSFIALYQSLQPGDQPPIFILVKKKKKKSMEVQYPTNFLSNALNSSA